VTPVSWLWFWRGLRGHSITFSLLFASVVLGASIYRAVHHALSALGFHWLLTLLIPIALFRLLSNHEARLIPDPRRSQWIALSILLGSCVVAWSIARLNHR
jgi:hypothetical protein